MNELLEVRTDQNLVTPVPELVLLEPAGSHEVLEVFTDQVLLGVDKGDTLVEVSQALTLLTEGVPGPPGPPGTAAPKSPTLAYTGDLLTGITYADGSTKALAYDADARLVQVDFGRIRKTLSYDSSSRLVQVLETMVP